MFFNYLLEDEQGLVWGYLMSALLYIYSCINYNNCLYNLHRLCLISGFFSASGTNSYFRDLLSNPCTSGPLADSDASFLRAKHVLPKSLRVCRGQLHQTPSHIDMVRGLNVHRIQYVHNQPTCQQRGARCNKEGHGAI